MSIGLLSGILWALDTVILGIALAMSPFQNVTFLAPFISTFLHDLFSSVWMLIYMGIKRQYKQVLAALKTRSGRFVVLAALLGGPIGMSGYVAAINYMGPAYTAIVSSFFPALGALLSYIFLKEKMKPYQIAGLLLSIAAIIVMGYTPGGGEEARNIVLGFILALVCCVGWASEAVIIAYGMKDPNLSDEQALQIRQITSALTYGVVLLPILRGWGQTVTVGFTNVSPLILLAALFGTASYVLYYKAITNIGAAKSMALNITYAAWSIVFALILLKDVPDLKTILCGIVIVFGSIVAAADLSEFRRRNVS